MKKHYIIGILLGCLLLLGNLSSCAHAPEILLDSEVEYIIPAGQPFTAIYDGVLKERIAPADLVVMDLGRKLKLEQEANEAAVK